MGLKLESMNVKRYVPWVTGLFLVIYVAWTFAPLLGTFFYPQDFVSFLNPLKNDVPFGQYIVDSWSWMNDQGKLSGFFRPLVNLTFLGEYHVFGFNPTAYRLINFVMHFLCVFAIYRFVKNLSGRKWLAAASSTIFLVHPGTVVAIGMIVARGDIMVCLFSILALNAAYLLSREKEVTHKAFLPALYFLLAMCSKELGMINILTLPIMYFLWPGRKSCRRNTIVFLTSLVLVLVPYIVSRLLIFGDIGGYGYYTAMREIPAHILILISQVSGTFFMGRFILRLFVYMIIAGLLLNYTGLFTRKWRKLAVAVLVTGAYSCQSIISDAATHYVYIASAFTVIFLVYFAGSMKIAREKYRAASLAAVLCVVVLGVLTRRESVNFSNIFPKNEIVFYGLENIYDTLPREREESCHILLRHTSLIESEMRNIPIYLDYLDSDNECVFIFTDDIEARSDVPIIVWENNELIVRR
ncbi:MAG: glycosyltransferase family 39 protein [Candidatus Aegiribacteria sp.]|nr:glycosyltransferase family 39 protein [Candidatus Aegiribacteria sp.]